MTPQPTAAALIIGNEILSGRTADLNIRVIAQKMAAKGIRLTEVRIVPDEEERIIEAINELRGRATYLLTTGGIGPTHDDITMQAVAKAFGVPLEERDEALTALEGFYGAENMNGGRRRMALMPAGATLIPTPVTAAPGVRIGNVFVLAGVPEIMQGMLAALEDLLVQGAPAIIRTIRCEGLPESLIADELAALAAAMPEVEIGSYPSYQHGTMGLALVVRGTEANRVNAAADSVAALLAARGASPEIVSGY